jgi:hypothetical protein
LRDTAGLPIWPADLAHPSWFKGGSSPSDVYRTLMTGMDGTPMPGYGDVFADLAAEKPWQLIAYIASLSREKGSGGIGAAPRGATTARAAHGPPD